MRIVLTGKSNSGKSILLELLKDNSKNLPIFKETAREILIKYGDYSNSHKRVKMLYEQWLKEESNKKGIFDRSMIDYIVFSRRQGIHIPFYEERMNHRYDLVFKLPNRPFKQDGTRVEKDDKEAQEIQDKIEKLYMETGHTLIEVPNVELVQKYNFILPFIQHAR